MDGLWRSWISLSFNTGLICDASFGQTIRRTISPTLRGISAVKTHISSESGAYAQGGSSLIGFLELSLRSYAEGTGDSPVPYVEGWFVRADARGKGAGKALMEKAMDWSSSRGFADFASDTDLSNEGSIRAHRTVGFKEVGRQVALLRPLKSQY